MSMYTEKVMDHFKNPRNMGEIPDADGVGTVGNPVCLAPETIVHINGNVTPIMNVSANLKVLGHDGKYHRIEEVITRPYKGKMYRIVAHNIGSTVITPDHHILALNASHFLRKYRSRMKCIRDWYPGDELEKGDILLYPVPNETIDTEKIPLDVERPKYDFRSKTLPDEIAVDSDFLRLIGYYLSEGYVRTQRCKGTLGFVFSSKEKSYIRDAILCVKRIFGLEPAEIKESHNAADIKFYSARLARFFSKHFGEGVVNKHIPHWVMLLPLQKQEALLCGLWRGDGYINDRVAKFVTISEQLAFQVRNLLLRQEIIMSFLARQATGIHKKSYSIYVKDDDSLRKLARIFGMELMIPKKLKNHHKAWFENGYFHVPIWRVEPLPYDGLVYNLKVEESHSFVSNSMALHNCGDLMTVYIKVKGNRIEDIKFKTFGCGAAIATSSMITELAKGKTIEEAMKISRGDVADSLGGLPPIKMHCSNLAADALHAAIKDYQAKNGVKQ
jgi:nitrogen fixation NifU-like protein